MSLDDESSKMDLWKALSQAIQNSIGENKSVELALNAGDCRLS